MQLADFDGVVFDLDGTILDSERIYHAGLMDAAIALGLPADADFFRTLLGLTFAAAMERAKAFYGVDFDAAAFDRASHEAVQQRIVDGIPLKAGAAALIDRFADAGLPLAIATSSRRMNVDHHLVTHGLHDAFRVIITQEDVSRTKPHPEPYLKATGQIGQQPGRCLAIEDSANGVRSAVAAGLSVVAVPDIAVLPEDLVADCLHVLDGLEALHDLVGRTK
jgi:HAD superfamily hydrolase (TIGR01509 family)